MNPGRLGKSRRKVDANKIISESFSFAPSGCKNLKEKGSYNIYFYRNSLKIHCNSMKL
jgi:hypothetical protein